MASLLSFLNPITDAIAPYASIIKGAAIAMGAAVIIGTIFFYVHNYQHMSSQIAIDQSTISQLNHNIQTEQQQILDLEKDAAELQKIHQNQTDQIISDQNQLAALEKQIAALNLPTTIITKPTQAETDINKLFDNIMQCLSTSTGVKNATCQNGNAVSVTLPNSLQHNK